MKTYGKFQRTHIHDKHELEFFKGIVHNFQASVPISLYRKPTEQLNNTIRDYDKIIIHQSPVTYYDGITHWSDFTLYNKKNDFLIRVEIKSLNTTHSGLDTSPFKALKHSKYMKENLMTLILIGEGYDDITPMLKEQIQLERLRVTIIRRMQDAIEFVNRNVR